jgi:hypothetical protein
MISVHKLLPLLAVGAIANHSKDAIEQRLAALNFNPRQFVVQNSMKNILYSIQLRNVGEESISIKPDVPSYIRQIASSNAGDPAKDPWGTYYKLFQRGNAVVIISAGPDKQFATQDDLTRTTPLLNY